MSLRKIRTAFRALISTELTNAQNFNRMQNPCNELHWYKIISVETTNLNIFAPPTKYGFPNSDSHVTCTTVFSKSLLCRISAKVNTILEKSGKKVFNFCPYVKQSFHCIKLNETPNRWTTSYGGLYQISCISVNKYVM